MSVQQQIEDILRDAYKSATSLNENVEGQKEALIISTAMKLLTAGVKKSKIASELVKTLATKEAKKKTGITTYRIYKALESPEYKQFKNPRTVRGKEKSSSFEVKRHNIPSHNAIQVTNTGQQETTRESTCAELLKEKVHKIKEINPEWSNKKVRDYISSLNEVKNKFSPSTLRREWSEILPLHTKDEEDTEPNKQEEEDTPQHIKHQEIARQNSIQQLEQMNQVIVWLTGMQEYERREFEKTLESGKIMRMELAEARKDHMHQLVLQMPESHIPIALQHTKLLVELLNVYDGLLYDEFKRRQDKQHLLTR